jgi:predicted PurR-regulated permease PerM
MRYFHILLPVLFAASLAMLLNHFLLSLAWAGLLAVITWPLHERLLRRGFTPLASATGLVLGIVLLFGAPTVFLLSTLGGEISTVERLLGQINQAGVPVPPWLAQLPVVATPAVQWWEQHLAVPGGLNMLIQTTAGDMVPHLTRTVGTLGPTLLANALYLFLAMLTLFVLYLEGPSVVRYVDRAGERVFPAHYSVVRTLFPLSVRGTALGLCSVALLEGVVLGIAYALAGAPAPAILGVVTGYLALIPGGAPLSFTLVSLLLLGQGHAGAALGLFCWGAFELFMVDKFIRPKLIGHRVDLPFLAVLFGLLGGVSTLGVIGLFVGPFMMAVLFWWLRNDRTRSVGLPAKERAMKQAA